MPWHMMVRLHTVSFATVAFLPILTTVAGQTSLMKAYLKFAKVQSWHAVLLLCKLSVVSAATDWDCFFGSTMWKVVYFLACQSFLSWLLSWYGSSIALFSCKSAETKHSSVSISSDETPFHRVHQVRLVNLIFHKNLSALCLTNSGALG